VAEEGGAAVVVAVLRGLVGGDRKGGDLGGSGYEGVVLEVYRFLLLWGGKVLTAVGRERQDEAVEMGGGDGYRKAFRGAVCRGASEVHYAGGDVAWFRC
jgi:hypothetical protein